MACKYTIQLYPVIIRRVAIVSRAWFTVSRLRHVVVTRVLFSCNSLRTVSHPELHLWVGLVHQVLLQSVPGFTKVYHGCIMIDDCPFIQFSVYSQINDGTPSFHDVPL